MRLSEILEHDVIDVEGHHVGRVHDVRVVREGPPQGMFGPSYQVAGLVIGGAAIGSRLGSTEPQSGDPGRSKGSSGVSSGAVSTSTGRRLDRSKVGW